LKQNKRLSFFYHQLKENKSSKKHRSIEEIRRKKFKQTKFQKQKDKTKKFGKFNQQKLFQCTI